MFKFLKRLFGKKQVPVHKEETYSEPCELTAGEPLMFGGATAILNLTLVDQCVSAALDNSLRQGERYLIASPGSAGGPGSPGGGAGGPGFHQLPRQHVSSVSVFVPSTDDDLPLLKEPKKSKKKKAKKKDNKKSKKKGKKKNK